jgi:NAD(P)-dependent dehydrogenase (short-subunit alcohol dehydrogenase family)
MNSAGLNKTIIITGASQGIGAATALLAAEQGYSVCINYHSNENAARQVLASIEENGGSGIAVAADVGNEQQVKHLFDEAEESLGPVCALVNNAGILERQTDFMHIDVQRFERILQTNLIGPFLCSREAVRRMSTENGGQGGGIVNISSVAALTGAPHEYIDYAASKGALDTMTVGLAREAAPLGIRVNSVRPGFIHTEMHAKGGEPNRVERLSAKIPLRRGGEAAEVASAVLWLLSEEAAYAVGATIDVAGGV